MYMQVYTQFAQNTFYGEDPLGCIESEKQPSPMESSRTLHYVMQNNSARDLVLASLCMMWWAHLSWFMLMLDLGRLFFLSALALSCIEAERRKKQLE